MTHETTAIPPPEENGITEHADSATRLNPVVEAALCYAKQRIAVTPVNFMTKVPKPDWDRSDFSPEDFPRQFRGKSNIGGNPWCKIGWSRG